MTKRFLSIFTFVLLVLNSFAQESTLVINTEFPVTFDSWSVSFLIEKTDLKAGDKFVFTGEAIEVADWEWGAQLLPKNNGDWSDLGSALMFEDGKATFIVTEEYAEIINNNGGLRIQGMACVVNAVEFIAGSSQGEVLVIKPELPVIFDSWSVSFLIEKTDLKAGDKFVFTGEAIEVADWEWGAQLLPKNNGDWSTLGAALMFEDGKATFIVTEEYAEIINNNGGLRIQGMACVVNAVEFIAAQDEPVESDEENLAIVFNNYPWNYTHGSFGSVNITYNNQWGEFAIVRNVSTAEYKGVRIEFVGDASTVVDGNYVQFKVVAGDVEQYFGINPASNAANLNFNATIMDVGNVDVVNLQGQAAGPFIQIVKAYLVTVDDELVPIEALDGGGWGYNATLPSNNITFTGQWGAVLVSDSHGNDITYQNGAGEQVYKYVIEIDEENAPANTFFVELNDGSNGFSWFNYESGTTRCEFTVDDNTCGTSDAEGAFIPKNLAKIYIKANSAEGYPFNLSIKRIYRVPVIESKPGDVNGDGEVDVNDIVCVADYILGQEVPVFIFENADLDGSGDINVTDISKIVDIILGY